MKSQLARAIKAAHKGERPKTRTYSPKSGRANDWAHRDQRRKGPRHEFVQASA